jgi:tetratricopeptide (TPR) repeat protein
VKTDAPAATPVSAPESPKPVEVKTPLPGKFDEALAKGRELLAKGAYGDAKEMLESAIALDKKKAEPHVEIARLYIALGERGKAIASAKQAIKLAPLSSRAWNTKGRAELNAHNYDNAIEAFSKAIELDRDNVFAWNNLGYTELLLRKYEDAAEHLSEATRRTGATGYMFNNLGTALEHLDRLDEARAAYEAGGKLGSKEAMASRKRLEGVKTIAIARVERAPRHPEVRGDGKSKEYELTDEGNITDEDRAMEAKGSAASDEAKSAPAQHPSVDELASGEARDGKVGAAGGVTADDAKPEDAPAPGTSVKPVE